MIHSPDFKPVRRVSTRIRAAALALAGAILFAAAPVEAALSRTRPVPAPARKARPLKLSATAGANRSYLVDTAVRKPETLNDRLFDAQASRALREQYENELESYEAREKAGLVEHTEERTRFTAMRDFAKRAMEGVSKFRAKIAGRTLKKSAENSNLPREPIAAAVLAASLYTGRSMNFKVLEGVRVHSRVDLKDKAASFSVPLSQMGLTSTVAYNRDTNVTAQLAQRVTDQVSAVVDSGDKGTARLVYSVSF